ncbi:MAG: hypothetical protein C0605_08365 [Hyphomicrobiales bacterium]|nr:MAG: hypothetical protein C0605_08365 [Hyphomicrobiales bacterium]
MKAFHELEEKGFIKSKQKGGFDFKIRHATTWILTEYGHGGKLATKDFMSWGNSAENGLEEKTRYHEMIRTVSRSATVKPKMTPLTVSPRATHIIYHVGAPASATGKCEA